MRVLFVIETLGLGGAERALVNIAPSWKENGVEAVVAALWSPYSLGEDLEALGVRVERFEFEHRWNLAAGTARLARLRRKVRPDLVHAHSFFASAYAGLSGIAGAPTLITAHTLQFSSTFARSPAFHARRALATSVARLPGVHYSAVSEAVADHMRKTVHVNRVDVIPNSIPLGAIRAIPHSPRESAVAGNIRLVVPARLSSEKNHAVLLDALAIARRQGVDVKCECIGDGPLRQELLDQATKLGLGEALELPGMLPNREVLERIAAADAVVLPSKLEGLPVVLLEAMALGRAIIATPVGGVGEIVHHGREGELVAPNDPIALADAIIRFANDPARRLAYGRTGETAVDRFDVAAVGAAWASLYRTIVRKS